MLKEDGCAFGGWCSIPSPFAAELMGRAGFDYVCIDCQHGLIGFDAMVPMLQAMSASQSTAIVRVPWNDRAWIGKALDAGAHGVIVPMVDTREQAEAAVASCRYAPEGIRSFGPSRGRTNSPLCFVMIETRAAVGNADDICATPGVSGVYIGPSDLGMSLGLGPAAARRHPEHIQAVASVREACARAGIASGIHSASGAQAAAYAADGFRFVTVTADSGLISGGAARELAAARGGADRPTDRATPY